MATQQIVHIVVEDGKAELQDGFYAVIKETVHHIHRALYRQHANEESQEPRQRHRREERKISHVLGQLGQVLTDQLLEHGLVHQRSWETQIADTNTQIENHIYVCEYLHHRSVSQIRLPTRHLPALPDCLNKKSKSSKIQIK